MKFNVFECIEWDSILLNFINLGIGIAGIDKEEQNRRACQRMTDESYPIYTPQLSSSDKYCNKSLPRQKLDNRSTSALHIGSGGCDSNTKIKFGHEKNVLRSQCFGFLLASSS